MLEDCAAPHLLEEPVNLLRVALHPDGLAPHIDNFPEYAGHLVARLEREVSASGDSALTALRDEVCSYPRVPRAPEPDEPAVRIAIPLEIRALGERLSMFSTIATFGTALDVTVDELTVEMYFPTDAGTEELFNRRFVPARGSLRRRVKP